MKSFSCVWHLATPWTVAYQDPLSMGFSRQEYWSGLPFPSPGDLPNPGIKPASLTSLALAGEFFTSSATWEAQKKVKLLSRVQLCNPMYCSLPGSSVHGIFQARVLEWVAISFSSRSSQPRDLTRVSHTAGRCFTVWATREAQYYIQKTLKTLHKNY